MSKKGPFFHRYFSKFLLLYSLVFFLTMILVVLLAFSTVYRIQQETFVRESEKSIGVLFSEMEKRHISFYHVLFRLYENGGGSRIIELFSSQQSQQVIEDASLRRELFTYIDDAVVIDDSISLVLLYDREGSRCFLFDRHGRTFNAVDADFPFFSHLIEKTQLRITMPSRVIPLSGRVEWSFAIGGNISPQDFLNPVGFIGVVYTANTFASSIQTLNTELPIEHSIVMEPTQEIIFNSSIKPETKEFNVPSIYTQKNGRFVVNTYVDEQRNYTYISEVEKAELLYRSQGPLFLIGLGVLVLVLIFVFMLTYTIKKTEVRVGELLGGMERLGKNDFDVRLRLRGTSDEFDRLNAHFNTMCDELQSNIKKAYVFELQKNQAELGELQSRINPHFLGNTIELMRSMLSQKHYQQVDEMMFLLARYYRLKVRGGAFVFLRDELDATKLYLEMMSLRYGERFVYDMEIEDGLEQIGVIRSILQPLLENYFQHGFIVEKETNQLHVQIHKIKESLVIKVSDNGRGMEHTALMALREYLSSDAVIVSKGYGLASISARLKLVYGRQASLEIRSSPLNGFTTIVSFSAEQKEVLHERMQVPNIHS